MDLTLLLFLNYSFHINLILICYFLHYNYFQIQQFFQILLIHLVNLFIKNRKYFIICINLALKLFYCCYFIHLEIVDFIMYQFTSFY